MAPLRLTSSTSLDDHHLACDALHSFRLDLEHIHAGRDFLAVTVLQVPELEIAAGVIV